MRSGRYRSRGVRRGTPEGLARLREKCRQFREVRHDRRLERGLMQCGRRMKHGDHITIPDLPHLSVDRADLYPGHELPHGKASEGNDDTWIDRLDLALKIFITGSQFRRFGIAV